MRPVKRSTPVPALILQICSSGLRKAVFMPTKDPVTRTVNTKNGNNEGITVAIHKDKPVFAPKIAVFVSKITVIIAIAATAPVHNLCFIVITSKESMPLLEKTSPVIHMLF
jgi:hypothetical protein